MVEESTEYLCEDMLLRIRNEIITIFEKAIHDDSVYFVNQHLVKCWETMECGKKDCPVHDGNLHLRCWQVAGTYCGGVIQGAFADKYHNCKNCKVFKEVCPTIVEELGEHLNNMLFLMRKEKMLRKKNQDKIEYLNKELISSLENLDSRNREIQQMVITDKLTGLYNRHYMMTVLEDEILRCQRKGYEFSLLMLDVDNFKSFNDSYGHLLGDSVLSTLGNIIKKNVRQYDRAFRYGGEEFVVVLPETNPTIAWMVAERIREKFAEEKYYIRTEEELPELVSRTVSIGVVSYQSGMTINTMLAKADAAMYQAKSQGKNSVVRAGDDIIS